MGSRGVRNSVELTESQISQLRQSAGQIGLSRADIDFTIGPSRFSEQLDQILIGPDVLPASSAQRLGGSVFERLTPRAVVAHEAGHLLTTRAGRAFPGGSLLDEVQASLVGRSLPGLNKVERFQLLRDAVERARDKQTSNLTGKSTHLAPFALIGERGIAMRGDRSDLFKPIWNKSRLVLHA